MLQLSFCAGVFRLDEINKYGADCDDVHDTLSICVMVVAGANHLQSEFDVASAQELGKYPWGITPEDCPFHAISLRFFRRHGLDPQHVALIDDESIIKAMVKLRSSDGC